MEDQNTQIVNTANIINNTNINYLSTLQQWIEDDVKDKFYKQFDNFIHLNDVEILEEQKLLLENIKPLNKIIFRSNHASNALHLAGNLPKDNDKLILEINNALAIGENAFIPNIMRGF